MISPPRVAGAPRPARRVLLGVLDRALLRELVGPFLGSTALLTFVLISERITRLTDLVVVQGVPLSLVLGLAAFALPALLVHTVPMGFLIAVLLVLGRLREDLELVALGAAGVGPGRLLRPVVGAAAGLGVTMAVLTCWLTPLANAAFVDRLDTLVRRHAASAIRAGTFSEPVGGFRIYVRAADHAAAAFQGVLVADERDPRVSRILTARRAVFLPRAGCERLTLRLGDGAVHESEPARPGHYRATGFERYEMALPAAVPRNAAAGIPHREETLTLRELRAEILERQGRGEDATRGVLDLHKRFAFPLEVLLFAVVGVGLGLQPRRWRRGGALGQALAVGVGFYVLLSGLGGVALGGGLSPAVAVWAAPAAIAALGAWALRATTRPPSRTGPSPEAPSWQSRAWSRPGRLHARPGAVPRTPLATMDRYLLARHGRMVGAVLSAGAALYLVVDVLQTMDAYLGRRPPLATIAWYEVLQTIHGLHQQLPIAVAVATALLFVSLARHHELTAFQAAGVSLYRVSRPVLLLALGISVAALILQETLLPALHARAEAIYRTEISGKPLPEQQTRSGIWYRDTDGQFVRVGRLDPVTRRLEDPTIIRLDGDDRVARRVEAREARWTPGGWELRDGRVREFPPDGTIRTMPFASLSSALTDGVEDMTRPWRALEFVSSGELRADVARRREDGAPVRDLLVELHARWSFALVPAVAALVAIPLALGAPGVGRLTGVAAVLLLTMVYWPLQAMALALARAGVLSPLLGAWSGDVVFAGLGLSLLLRART